MNNEPMKEDLKKYIGEQIRILRKEKNMTQRELGKLLGLKHNSISAIERGVNSFESNMIFKVAKIFNVKADDLFPPLAEKNDPNDYIFRYAIENTNLEAKDVLMFREIIEKTNYMTELQRKKYIENLLFIANYFEEQYQLQDQQKEE